VALRIGAGLLERQGWAVEGDGKALNYFEVADFSFTLTPVMIAEAAKSLSNDHHD
jgi:hypothetical protein